ncbi:HET-domain-containing protein [Trametes sanguinea]|nr:HET-domain-containing protein [Trametes sanguinea]
MWLLSTLTGILQLFHDPSLVKYAILSHVWLANENTFQDLQRFHKESPDAVLEHPDLSAKIKDCCKAARELGYFWVWIDTCCIDKSSSAELSEAITAMYRWYQQADVCFAFLHDLGRLIGLADCRWFRRGWTLQELIAPPEVLFYNCDWSRVGTRSGLASALSTVTGIGSDILTRSTPLSSVSVAQRMSWASKRETTREEDRAYSLLGIFGVYMPIMYGEGTNAFYRLQEVILREIPDQSIFAWGYINSFNDLWDSRGDFLAYASSLPPPPEDATSNSLFASSPALFNAPSDEQIEPVKIEALRRDLNMSGIPIPKYTFTSYGVSTRFPVMVLPQRLNVDSSRYFHGGGHLALARRQSTVLVAILACRREGRLLGLLLAPTDGLGLQYEVGVRFKGRILRATWVPANTLPDVGDLTMKRVYIARRPSEVQSSSRPTPYTRHGRSAQQVTRIRSGLCERPCMVIVRRWTRLDLEKVGFVVVSVSRPFERADPGTRVPTFIALCRGTERIWIDFGTCPVCDPDPLPASGPLTVSVSYSNVPREPLPIRPYRNTHRGCCGGRTTCALDKSSSFTCGPFIVELLFNTRPPISIYDDCNFYDLQIQISPSSEHPRALHSPSPLPHSVSSEVDPYSPRPLMYPPSNFPLWEGSPLWAPAGRLPKTRQPPWQSGSTTNQMPPAYSYDGRYLASVHVSESGAKHTVVVRDILRVGVIGVWAFNCRNPEFPHRLAFSPDGTDRLAMTSCVGGLHIWSVERDEYLSSMGMLTDSVLGFGWSRDGKLLALDDSRSVCIWDTDPSRDTYQQLYHIDLRDNSLHFDLAFLPWSNPVLLKDDFFFFFNGADDVGAVAPIVVLAR